MTAFSTAVTTLSGASAANARVQLIPAALYANMQLLLWFGTDALGQAGNQAPGNAPVTPTGTGPTYLSDNTAVINSGAVYGSLDTSILFTSGLVASGMTFIWAAQSLSSSVAAIFSAGPSVLDYLGMHSSDSNFGSPPPAPAVLLNVNGQGPSASGGVQTGSQGVMRLYGASWAGNNNGSGNPFLVYDFTGGTSGQTIDIYTMAVAATTNLAVGTFNSAGALQPFKMALAFMQTGVVSGALLTASVAAFRSQLLLRSWSV